MTGIHFTDQQVIKILSYLYMILDNIHTMSLSRGGEAHGPCFGTLICILSEIILLIISKQKFFIYIMYSISIKVNFR